MAAVAQLVARRQPSWGNGKRPHIRLRDGVWRCLGYHYNEDNEWRLHTYYGATLGEAYAAWKRGSKL